MKAGLTDVNGDLQSNRKLWMSLMEQPGKRVLKVGLRVKHRPVDRQTAQQIVNREHPTSSSSVLRRMNSGLRCAASAASLAVAEPFTDRF